MKHITSLLMVAVLSATVATSSAAEKAKATPLPPKHTVIASIGGDSITIDTGKSTKNYKIDKNTTFFFEGARVTSSELKPGMRVSIVQGFDGKTAASITALDAPKKVAAPAPAKK